MILAWPRLLLVAEAKTGSPNEILKGDTRGKLDRYTGREDLFSAPLEAVRALGYYELVRNWRIAAELADAAGIANSVLVNLGPAALRADVLELRQVIAGSNRRLEHLRWPDVLRGLDVPEFFAAYVDARGLTQS